MKKHFTQLKNQVRTFKEANSPLLRALYWTIKKPFEIKSFLTEASHRSVVITKLISRRQAHQFVNYTALHRYPTVFRACAEYFPHAELIGVDINHRNIRVARASRKKDASMNFCTEIPAQGQYDAIFCMAVLQRTENRLPNTTDSSQIYPFHRFDAQVAMLDAQLNVGGLFVMDHADYRFEDTRIAAKYQPIDNPPRMQRTRPVFNRNNQRSTVPYDNPRVFKKIA